MYQSWGTEVRIMWLEKLGKFHTTRNIHFVQGISDGQGEEKVFLLLVLVTINKNTFFVKIRLLLNVSLISERFTMNIR